MARFNINDGSSGKVGNVVTYQMYGKSYMRSLPAKYTDRKSEKQLAQRQKMQLINGFLSPYKDLLRLTFQKEAVGRSAYGAAKSYNLLHAITGEFPDQYIDYSRAMVALGSVSLPLKANVERTDEGLLFHWNNDGDGHRSDTLLVIAHSRGLNKAFYKQTGVERHEESYLWRISDNTVESHNVWLVFRDYKERGFSNSMWLGLV